MGQYKKHLIAFIVILASCTSGSLKPELKLLTSNYSEAKNSPLKIISIFEVPYKYSLKSPGAPLKLKPSPNILPNIKPNTRCIIYHNAKAFTYPYDRMRYVVLTDAIASSVFCTSQNTYIKLIKKALKKYPELKITPIKTLLPAKVGGATELEYNIKSDSKYPIADLIVLAYIPTNMTIVGQPEYKVVKAKSDIMLFPMTIKNYDNQSVLIYYSPLKIYPKDEFKITFKLVRVE